jgi:hypothetical protein
MLALKGNLYGSLKKSLTHGIRTLSTKQYINNRKEIVVKLQVNNHFVCKNNNVTHSLLEFDDDEDNYLSIMSMRYATNYYEIPKKHRTDGSDSHNVKCDLC